MAELNVYKRLLSVQKELKAPRDVDGRFGKARSAEKILEAVKPICQKHGLLLYTTDTVEQIGERNYITTTSRVINVDTPEEFIEAKASAWENNIAAGLDTSQVSGKTSSYGKKYSLQNLFAIDDTKDADVEHTDATPVESRPKAYKQFKATKKQLEELFKLAKDQGFTDQSLALEWLTERGGNDPRELNVNEAVQLIQELHNEDKS